IIRNHRLWEVFLVQKLRFNWDEVHEIAEELEHITHHQLINRLDEFLGFPAFDPHGDPIPSANGEIQPAQHVPLHDLQVNEKGLVAGVKESSNSLLQYLDKIGLKIGSACFVVEHIAFDNSVEILIEKDKKVIISREVARNVLISPQAN
ncbi:MAG: metal-dependent transcriptional regulator, partial [Verrucomicrobia bacterium]|nr:metal-dependent transcriptional regulator [Cytophagales bacterium]